MKVDKLQVFYENKLVGTLALTPGQKAAFEYDDNWLENGFSINPFSLPLKKQVFIPSKNYFDGLFGVFADSLPDAWGNLLLNRLMRKNGKDPGKLTVLDRLAIVGNSGMGALTYKPVLQLTEANHPVDLDYLAAECQKILNTEYTTELDGIYKLGGTSGGARPKILTVVDDEDWIIKFPAHVDGKDAGKMEYNYAVCAKACGIVMPECRLFSSKECPGYFGAKRFDRIKKAGEVRRVHMLTAAALLELNFEEPSLDYHSLMKLTKIITGNCVEDLENMFRRMCFNVFAHNRDDHSKNFAYLYEADYDKWRLSPAYDLTYSNTYYGEHTTSVDGNGRNPGLKEIVTVGTAAGLKKRWCTDTAKEIEACVHRMLGNFLFP